MSRGKGSAPTSQVSSKQEINSRVTSTYYKMVGAEAAGSTQSGYFKRCPRKSKVGTCGGNPKLRSLSKCPGSGCEQGYYTVKS